MKPGQVITFVFIFILILFSLRIILEALKSGVKKRYSLHFFHFSRYLD